MNNQDFTAAISVEKTPEEALIRSIMFVDGGQINFDGKPKTGD